LSNSRADFNELILNDPLVRDIWHAKYRHGKEASPADTRFRVAQAICVNDPMAHGEMASYIMSGLLVPAGRINAGIGTDKRVTLLNCYVSDTIDDSMAGIQMSIAQAALTMQQGGGIGSDYSTIRPNGAIVGRTGSVSSGVIPFADQQDAMCKTVVSAGTRRGAMMLTLRDDHPDLWNPEQFETHTDYYGETVLKNPSFISVKRQRGRLTQFNISILVSDKFMKAVAMNLDWDLGFHVPRADGQHVAVYDKEVPNHRRDVNNDFVRGPTVYTKGSMAPWYVYRRVKARVIWEDIMRSTYTYAEPGIIFIDQVNLLNNLSYAEDIRCTNPCGEQPLPPHGTCCLGSVNLAFFVENPFEDDSAFNWDMFAKVTRMGVRMLDNVLDLANYPLHDQHAESMYKRRIGLGITGFADALLQLGYTYGSRTCLDFTAHLAQVFKIESYRSTIELASQRGPAPAFDFSQFRLTEAYNHFPLDLRNSLAEHGMRNGVVNTIAPNGTISMYSGNVASGHEPVFSFDKTKRRVRQPDGSAKEYESVNYSYRLFEHLNGPTPRDQLPPYFVGAMDITPEEHLAVHAAWQRKIDASISKTINCPTEMTFDDFREVYQNAYKLGCKGVTTYRYDPAAGRGFVMSAAEAPTHTDMMVDPETLDKIMEENPLPEKNSVTSPMLRERPAIVEGRTYKLNWALTNTNWYVNITRTEDGPLEMFITTQDVQSSEWVTAFSRLVTAVLRRGGNFAFLVHQLKEVHSPRGGVFIDGKFCPSIVAAIGRILEKEIVNHEEPEVKVTVKASDVLTPINTPTQMQAAAVMPACPVCHQHAIIHEAGCKKCIACGHEECG
jgi:ribonucleoside-diphosphate reductase alpha chain